MLTSSTACRLPLLLLQASARKPGIAPGVSEGAAAPQRDVEEPEPVAETGDVRRHRNVGRVPEQQHDGRRRTQRTCSTKSARRLAYDPPGEHSAEVTSDPSRIFAR
jgi:hypothetical protein